MNLLEANALGQSHLAVGDAAVAALLGYAIVFLGLILLMIVEIFMAKDAKKKAAAPAAAPAAAAPAAPQKTAPGAAGQLKLYNVEPKTAAMVMAIVADKMGKPLNELRFISIKEVQ